MSNYNRPEARKRKKIVKRKLLTMKVGHARFTLFISFPPDSRMTHLQIHQEAKVEMGSHSIPRTYVH